MTTTALDRLRCRRCGSTHFCEPCKRAVFVPWTIDPSTVALMRPLDHVADLREGRCAPTPTYNDNDPFVARRCQAADGGLQPGDRVRHKYDHHHTGTVTGGDGRPWLSVRWDIDRRTETTTTVWVEPLPASRRVADAANARSTNPARASGQREEQNRE